MKEKLFSGENVRVVIVEDGAFRWIYVWMIVNGEWTVIECR